MLTFLRVSSAALFDDLRIETARRPRRQTYGLPFNLDTRPFRRLACYPGCRASTLTDLPVCFQTYQESSAEGESENDDDDAAGDNDDDDDDETEDEQPRRKRPAKKKAKASTSRGGSRAKLNGARSLDLHCICRGGDGSLTLGLFPALCQCAAPNLFVSKAAQAENSDSGDDYAAKSHKKGAGRKTKRARSETEDDGGPRGRPKEYSKYDMSQVDYGLDSEDDDEMQYTTTVAVGSGACFLSSLHGPLRLAPPLSLAAGCTT